MRELKNTYAEMQPLVMRSLFVLFSLIPYSILPRSNAASSSAGVGADSLDQGRTREHFTNINWTWKVF